MRELRRIYRRWALFLGIVWRPAWPPPEAGWWESYWSYGLDISTAWEVAGVLWGQDVKHRGRGAPVTTPRNKSQGFSN